MKSQSFYQVTNFTKPDKMFEAACKDIYYLYYQLICEF